MTLVLDKTRPPGVEVKTHGFLFSPEEESMVRVGDYQISFNDFLVAAHYVLTNTDIKGPDDPRIKFVESTKKMVLIEGYNKGARRFSSPESPFAVF